MRRHAVVAPLALALLLAGCASEPPPPAPPRDPAPLPEPGPPPRTDDLQFPSTEDWLDDTQGQTATLVYVTEKGRSRDQAQAAAIVFSSDPQNAHFKRKSTARVTVQRLTRADMATLLRDLAGLGFDALPWKEQPYDAEIGAQRALYLYRGGKRVRVDKDALPEPARLQFTEIERRLIQASLRGVAGD